MIRLYEIQVPLFCNFINELENLIKRNKKKERKKDNEIRIHSL